MTLLQVYFVVGLVLALCAISAPDSAKNFTHASRFQIGLVVLFIWPVVILYGMVVGDE